jgi:hypothetical protein
VLDKHFSSLLVCEDWLIIRPHRVHSWPRVSSLYSDIADGSAVIVASCASQLAWKWNR